MIHRTDPRHRSWTVLLSIRGHSREWIGETGPVDNNIRNSERDRGHTVEITGNRREPIHGQSPSQCIPLFEHLHRLGPPGFVPGRQTDLKTRALAGWDRSMAEIDNQDQEKRLRELEKQNHELARDIAVLRQTMEPHKQEYKTDIARLAEQMANWKTDMAQRENRQLLAIIVVVGVATAILGVLIAGIPAT